MLGKQKQKAVSSGEHPLYKSHSLRQSDSWPKGLRDITVSATAVARNSGSILILC